MQPKVKFQWKGNHHLYYGLWILAFAIFNVFMGQDNAELTTLMPFWYILAGIGGLMIIDDVIEHTITASTPLRILYVKIIRPILIKQKR